MDRQSEYNDLAAFFEDQLPIFDQILAGQQMPLRQRPLAATVKFVTYCIVKIEGDDKENFIEKPWFKSVYQLISEWYARRYGDAIKHRRDNSSNGVVLIYDTPFRISIPFSIPGKRESATKRWLCFPTEVLSEENVFDWFASAPNFKKMPSAELSFVERDVRTVAAATRTIRVNLMTATLHPDAMNKLAGGVTAHIEKSVSDILSLDEGRIANSFWETHLAVEKSLKLLIRQHGTVPPKIHDLEMLCKIANGIDDVSIDSRLLKNLPLHREAIRRRYGDGDPVTVKQAILNYGDTLTVLKSFTEALSRQFVMKNAKFLIRALPWKHF